MRVIATVQRIRALVPLAPVLIPVLVVVAYALVLLLIMGIMVLAAVGKASSSAEDCTPSSQVGSVKGEVPKFLIPIYQEAATEYKLGEEGPAWLAGINRVESTFGTNLSTSSAGAQGWMQFLPGTWRAYGVDANGDGRKDPNDPHDAIHAAANYLHASGAPRDWHRAVFAYNHLNSYVALVEDYKNKYLKPVSETVDDGGEGNPCSVADEEDAAVGGSSSARELLNNPRVNLSPAHRADIKAGVIDGRVIYHLSTASKKWTLTVSSLKSDHDRKAKSGNVSNHFYGRAVDISAVDGKPCISHRALCRKLSRFLVGIGGKNTSTEMIFVDDPDGPGNRGFARADHADHVHDGFKN